MTGVTISTETMAEWASRYGFPVCDRPIRRWVVNGLIPARRLTPRGSWRIDVADAITFLSGANDNDPASGWVVSNSTDAVTGDVHVERTL